MEANKENVHRTRIPLPKDPLPALPKYLFIENKNIPLQKQGKENHHQHHARAPLKTLNTQIVPKILEPKPGPSKVLHKRPVKIDTRYVTMRPRKDVLDWSYKVYRNNENKENETSIITISDDEDDLDEKENKYLAQSSKKNNLGEALNAVTPNLKDSLESNRIKKIKRSLKRPHSRELQGLSPVADRGENCDDKVKRRLQFNERLQERLGTPNYWKSAYMRCLNRDYTLDLFSYLLVNEKKPLEVPRTSSITRACVINWLMKVNGPEGNPATILSACWYLDSILGTGHVQLEKLQLVAAACYWIAQKLHGGVSSSARIVRYANKAFSVEKLLAAEKTVLLRLRFPTQPVVAQEFITFFSWWCDNVNAGEIEVAATFLCQCGIMVDKVLCEEYPSVIAAAAVRNALVLLKKNDLVSRLHMSEIYQSAAKKAKDLSFTCSILRRAVRTVSDVRYEYKAPLEHYGGPPSYIAQKIVNEALEHTLVDVRNMAF